MPKRVTSVVIIVIIPVEMHKDTKAQTPDSSFKLAAQLHSPPK